MSRSGASRIRGRHGRNLGLAVSDQPDAAYLIRAKVAIGQLPRRAATRVWVGLGSGSSCDGCDQAITATDPEHRVDAIGLGTLRFHSRCMRLWEEASAMPRDIAGGSAPRPIALSVASPRPRVRAWRRVATLLLARSLVRLPAHRPLGLGGADVPRRGYAALAVVALAIVVVLLTRPFSDVGPRQRSPHHTAAPLEEVARIPVAPRLEPAPAPPRARPRGVASTARQRPVLLTPVASQRSATSAALASLTPARRPIETVRARPEEPVSQAP
jgi:hypothetical protein